MSIERRFAEAERYFTDGIAYCDEHDLGSHAVFLRGQRQLPWSRPGAGMRRWRSVPNCWPAADVSVYRLGPLQALGVIRARRGEPGAWEYLDEAAAAADASGEPQWIIPVRLARAEARWLQGELHEPRHEAERADDVAGGARRMGARRDRGLVAAHRFVPAAAR